MSLEIKQSDWPMQQKLTVNGKEIKPAEMHLYALRWGLNAQGEAFPVLYLEGRRVTKNWNLVIAVDVAEDTKGSSA